MLSDAITRIERELASAIEKRDHCARMHQHFAARVGALEDAVRVLRDAEGSTPTEAPPTAENAVQRKMVVDPISKNLVPEAAPALKKLRVELAPEGFIRPAELPVGTEPEDEPEPEPTARTDSYAPLREAIEAKRQEWAASGRMRENGNRDAVRQYLPRGLEPPAGLQLVRVYVEAHPTGWLTARQGAHYTGLTTSAVTHRLRELERQGVVVQHGRARKGKHPTEHLYARVEGVTRAPAVDDADGRPSPA